MDGDGLELLDLHHNVAFDWDDDGFAESTGWFGPDDAVLVIDRQEDGSVTDAGGDGKVTSGSELQLTSLLTDEQQAEIEETGREATDFDGLATLDSNSDGIIDASDENFTSLKVWQDKDSDGEVDEGEMTTLEEAGIQSFDLGSYQEHFGSITRLNEEGDEVEQGIDAMAVGNNMLHGWLKYTRTETGEDGEAQTGIAGDVAFTYFEDGFRIERDEDGGFEIIFEDESNAIGLEVISADEDADFQLDGLTDKVVKGDARGNRIDGSWSLHDIMLSGEAGNDILIGGMGRDQLFGGEGADELRGGQGGDMLVGGAGVDALHGEGGNDQVFADVSDDFSEVTGDEGFDTLFILKDGDDAGTGIDLNITDQGFEAVYGSEGDDSFEATGTQAVSMSGGQGDDRLSGADGADLIAGGAGHDSISGGDGNDRLSGGAGDDQIDGGKGDDLLVGSTGTDFLQGGRGNDVYSLNRGDGQDSLLDTAQAEEGDLVMEATTENLQHLDYKQSYSQYYVSYRYWARTRTRWGRWIWQRKAAYGHREGYNGQQITRFVDETGVAYVQATGEIDGGVDRIQVGAGVHDVSLSFDGDDLVLGLKDYAFTDERKRELTLAFATALALATAADADDTRFDGFDLSEEAFDPEAAEALFSDDEAASFDLFLDRYRTSGEGTVETASDALQAATSMRMRDFTNQNRRIEGLVLAGGVQIDLSTLSHAVTGTAANDVLETEAGATTTFITGGDGDDSITISAGKGIVAAGTGDDSVIGGAGDDQVFAGLGDDSVHGGGGDDLLLGEGGDDVLDGGAGDDQIDGGLGDDRLIGGAGDDTLIGGSGDDSLIGGDGDDRLYGGSGKDTLDGGFGDDTYFFGRGDGHDTIDEENFKQVQQAYTVREAYTYQRTYSASSGRGKRRRTYRVTRNFTAYRNVTRYRMVDVTADGGNDTLSFTGAVGFEDLFANFDGSDLVIGLRQLEVATDEDTGALSLTGNEVGLDEMADKVRIINWVNKNNQVETFEFADGAKVDTAEVTNWQSGLDEVNAFVGRHGGDFLSGGGGDDSLNGGAGNDILLGGTGDDIILGGTGDDDIFAGSGDDSVDGGDGDDVINGGAGDDVLKGGRGNDILSGGSGKDRMEGGLGDDVYHFGYGSGQDVINEESYNQVRYISGYQSQAYTYQYRGWAVRNFGKRRRRVWVNERRTGYRNVAVYAWKEVAVEGGHDTLQFGAGIGLGDLIVNKVDDAMVITLKDRSGADVYAEDYEGDQVTIEKWTTPEFRIEQFRFSNGFAVDTEYLDNAETLTTDEGGSLDHASSTANVWLAGGAGDDEIRGGSGHDVIVAGRGSDKVFGGAGNDTYVYSFGDGDLEIEDASGEQDALLFGEGITRETLIIETVGNDLKIAVLDHGRLLAHVVEHSEEGLAYRLLVALNRDVPSDDDVTDAVATLRGAGGLAGLVSDLLGTSSFGQSLAVLDDEAYIRAARTVAFGGETSAEELTEALDGFSDQASFLEGLLSSERSRTYWSRTTLDYLFGLPGYMDAYIQSLELSQWSQSITVRNWTDADSRVDILQFFDGTDFDISDISLAARGTADDDVMDGTAQGDWLDFGAGDDRTSTFGGDDFVMGREGDDFINLGDGDDTANGGAGNDEMLGGAGDDTLAGEAGDDLLNGGAGDDVLSAGTGDDELIGGLGSDVFIGEGGTDLIHMSNRNHHAWLESLYSYHRTNSLTVEGQTFSYHQRNTASVKALLEEQDVIIFGYGDGQDRVRLAHETQFDALIGETSNSSNQLARNEAIKNYRATSGVVSFSEGIEAEDIWFQRAGEDLVVRLLGTEDSLTFEEWFYEGRSAANVRKGINGFAAGEEFLHFNDVHKLVNAMAGFAPQTGVSAYGITGDRLPDSVQLTVDNTWKS